MMTTAVLVALFVGAACAERQRSETRTAPSDAGAIVCPPGTAHVTKTGEEIRQRYHFAQVEEFCVTEASYEGPGRRHGPYIQRGPNGERLLEGQYVDGKEHGIWARRSTTGTVAESWERGERKWSHKKSGERSQFNGIDVSACIPHSLHFPLTFGSARYTVVGRASDTCEVRTGGETEMWDHGLRVCRFPSAMARVPYHLGGHIVFGEAEKYCEHHPPARVPLWQLP